MLPLHTILCSTDWSEPSYVALEVAGEWATHFGAALCLLHVVKPLDNPGLLLPSEQIEEAMRADAQQQLLGVLRERVPNIPSARALVATGDPADEIAKIAARENADLLIIATHGQSEGRTIAMGNLVGRIGFGSVANNVVRLARCPVLTVRLPSNSAA